MPGQFHFNRRFLRQWNWDGTRTKFFHSRGFCRLTPHLQPCFWFFFSMKHKIFLQVSRQLGWGAFLNFVPKNLAGWVTSALLGLLQNSKMQGGISVPAVTELSRETHQKSKFGDLKMANVKCLKGQRPWAAQQKTQRQFWKLESPKCFNSPWAAPSALQHSHWCSHSLL